MAEDPRETTCWLCERPMGRRVQWHHPVPKAKKGRDVVPVHPICHRTIHANFTNAQLVRTEGSREVLLEHEMVAKFVKLVANKPPDFHAPTRRGR